MAASNIGMMDGAYFVGRNEILAWINTTLQLGLSKVEEVSDACVSCPRSGWGARAGVVLEVSRVCGEDAPFVRVGAGWVLREASP